ncbi:TadE/TadG family type IV pilus assembly protein [Shimia ponticola]|uniref:TadE/TadG family type IV pilus assembly protein n=1 Tax=Shimia ponticola TaxID=2582893 RepID=UPI00164B0D75|nr:TadE/TadG family type IV pilus assembly protein [Shimia ponticola]
MTLLRKLRRDDSGAILVLWLFLFLSMLVIVGMAVDAMRAESQRVKLQQTVDTAVLAAADLDQPNEAVEVVNDYFEKAGLEEFLGKVEVDKKLNYKRVSAVAGARVETKFLHISGVQSFPAFASGAAEERVSDIEISLVVDVSGSMGSNSRLQNLKTAAKQFFDLVVNEQTDESGITSVSIIPYNATVNVGPDILEHYNVTEWHDETHCIRFRDTDFETIAISTTDELERVAHFAEGNNSYNSPRWYHYHCEDESDHEILAYETDVSKMDEHIDGLSADGWTGIDNGMKWAAAMVDPAFRPVVNAMIDDQELPELIRDWPTDYFSEDTMKVIVLMTDGANTNQYDILDKYKAPALVETEEEADSHAWKYTIPGYVHQFPANMADNPPAMSPVYYSASAGSHDEDDGWLVYLSHESSSKRLYRPRSPYTTSDDDWYYASQLPSDAVQMSWQDLWAEFTTRDAADYFLRYSDPDGYWGSNYYGYSQWYGSVPSYYNAVRSPVTLHDAYGEVDDRLRDICDQVALKPVLVFSIAFEAPSGGESVMRYCASAVGNYYDVDGTDLSYAFQSIANQINHLRLIQ